jgi:hypothetical protein
MYIQMNIFLTPFCDKFFTTFFVSTAYFVIEATLINRCIGVGITESSVHIVMWCMLMLFSTYFMRRVLTMMFIKQMEAEKTGKTLTKILDNLPDAVLMLNDNQLCYCNKQSDSFFGVCLS